MRIQLLCLLLFQTGLLLAQEATFPIVQNHRWGLIDTAGQVLVEPQYDKIGDFRKGYARMQLNGKIGLLNPKGEIVLSPNYDFISLLSDSIELPMFIVEQEANWNVVATNGTIIIPNFKGKLSVFPKGFIGQYNRKDSSLWRMPSEKIVAEHFVDLQVLEGPYLLLRRSDKQAIYLEDGTPFIPFQYHRIEAQAFGYWKVMLNKTWGLLDSTAQEIILAPSNWSDMHVFHPRYAKVRDSLRRSYQFISLQTKEVSNFFADNFQHYKGDTLAYQRAGLWGLVHDSGKELTPPLFDKIRPFADSLLFLHQDKKVGLISQAGRIVLQPKYDKITPISGDIALAQGQTGQESGKPENYQDVISRSGQVVIKDIPGRLHLASNHIQQNMEGKIFMYIFSDKGSRYKREKVGQKKVIRISGRSSINRSNRPRTPAPRAKSDPRDDFPFQWILNRNPALGQANAWGLSYRDSLLDSQRVFRVPPMFVNINRPDRTPSITFVSQKVRIPGTTDTRELWGIFSNKVGKPLSRINIEKIHFNEFRVRPVVRCIFEGGTWGLIDTVGRIIAKDYSYIAPFEGKRALACKGGRDIAEMPEDVSIERFFSIIEQRPIQNESLEEYYQQSASAKYPKARWGFLDLNGQPIFKFDLEKVEPYIDGAALARQKGKWGLIDTLGLWIIEPTYEDASYVENSNRKLLLLKKQKSGLGAMNQRGQVIIPTTYERMLPQQEGFFAVRKDLKWGFADTLGQLRIPCSFDRVQSFSDGLAAARKKGKWGFIDSSGRWYIPPTYNSVGDFHEGHAWVFSREGRYYINKKRQKVLEGDFLKTSKVCQERVLVSDRQYYRLLRIDGTELFKSNHLRLEKFVQDRFIQVRLGNGKHRLMDLDGQWVSPQQFRDIHAFREGVALVEHENKRFLVDTSGQFTRVPYTTVDEIGSNRIPYRERIELEENRKIYAWGYMNLKGETVIQPIYNVAQAFRDGHAVVYKDYLFHLIDTLGQTLISLPHKHRLLHQQGGRMLLKIDRTYHYTAINLLPLLPTHYDEGKAFQSGVAKVRQGVRWGLIHKNGLVLCRPKFHAIGDWENGFAEVRSYYSKALVNRQGKFLSPAITDRVEQLNDAVIRVEAGNQLGYLRYDGNWLWPLQE